MKRLVIDYVNMRSCLSADRERFGALCETHDRGQRRFMSWEMEAIIKSCFLLLSIASVSAANSLRSRPISSVRTVLSGLTPLYSRYFLKFKNRLYIIQIYGHCGKQKNNKDYDNFCSQDIAADPISRNIHYRHRLGDLKQYTRSSWRNKLLLLSHSPAFSPADNTICPVHPPRLSVISP